MSEVNDAGYRPLCFVLMPFGVKADASGRPIDFDALYRDVYRPAIDAAGMEPIRADEEREGGIIHKPMFERLVLCPYALADLTLANANVFYELGVRHAVRPFSTVLAYEQGGQRLPFDVAPLRALPYDVDAGGKPMAPDDLATTISARLDAARENTADSPLYQLLDGFEPPDIARLKADVFREQIQYSEGVKRRLAAARRDGLAAVAAVHQDLRPISDKEAGIAVDLLLAYRDVDAHHEMVELVGEFSAPIARTVLVQEQLGFALNRLGRSEDAQDILERVLEEHGPSSETLGLLGRVHKDRWIAAQGDGATDEAAAHLRKAIAAYTAGFEADWRDAYPGVNAVTLMAIDDPTQPAFASLLPVVRYAVERRLQGTPDYWDHASMLELAVHLDNAELARVALGECLAARSASWQTETTARQLTVIADARRVAGADTSLVDDLRERLTAS